MSLDHLGKVEHKKSFRPAHFNAQLLLHLLDGPKTITELCTLMVRTGRTSLYTHLAVLEYYGLVTRVAESVPTGGRTYRYHLQLVLRNTK